MSGVDVCVVGALNLDLTAQAPTLPKPGETVLGSTLSRHPGGKGLNQAVAAARAGARVRLIGRVGRDAAGDELKTYLALAGVDVGQVQRDPVEATGQALITVSDAGENCIVVVPGANLRLTPPDADALAGARVVLAQLETALPAVAAAFAAAPARSLKLLNAAPASVQGTALIGACDVLIVNETELAAYAMREVPCDDLDAVIDAARGVRAHALQTVVVTLGAAGALVLEAQRSLHVPGRPARAVDTVGAGDCFCGVLAGALSEGLALADAVDRANVAAALAVTRRGAAEAAPTRLEILQAQDR